jgi:hypothetical protein
VTRFMAIKINYDRRASLPAGLKYSRLATTQENNEYLKLYQGKGIGGDGFHECLNFFISDNKPVRIYFPPTCRPDKKTIGDEFVIFSFTYASDPERPNPQLVDTRQNMKGGDLGFGISKGATPKISFRMR